MTAPLFRGPIAASIRAKHSLTEYVTHGSSAELYRHSPGVLWRLSSDAASHNLIIEGAGAKLAFPDVVANCGSLGVSDRSDWDHYWLGAFEECASIDGSVLPAFASFVEGLRDVCEEHGIEARHGLSAHRDFVASNATLLSELGLLDSLRFVFDFAEVNEADLDVDITNFMISRSGRLVITDLVHGCAPEMFLELPILQ